MSLWEYHDDHGKVQGPFSAPKLLGWLRAGHVKASRMVRRHGVDGEGRFSQLSSTQPFERVLGAGLLPAPPPAMPLHVGSAVITEGVVGEAAAGGAFVQTPMWLFVDAQGKDQGPFAAWQIAAWHQAASCHPRR